MRRPFRRREDVIEVALSDRERAVLSELPGILASVRDHEPAAARLDLPAHRDDPEASARFRDLVSDELRRARAADRAGFAGSVSARRLSDEQAEMWMRVVGETRIVLGARLGIEHDGWEEDKAMMSSPQAAMLQYLGYLQDSLARVLGEGL